MIQFKEKGAGQPHVRLSLLTYPVLMAADILQHDTHDVPVGSDQSQHVELTRDVAMRFNARYGDTFVVPKAVNPTYAARIMDLADPLTKMGKSSAVQAGVIRLLDPPDTIAPEGTASGHRRRRRGPVRSGREARGRESAGDPGRVHRRADPAESAFRHVRRAEGGRHRCGDHDARAAAGAVRRTRRRPAPPSGRARRRGGAGPRTPTGDGRPGRARDRTVATVTRLA